MWPSFLILVSYLEFQIVYLQFALSAVDATEWSFDYLKNGTLKNLFGFIQFPSVFLEINLE